MVIGALVIALAWSTTASAQLDPLLFVKRVPPTVIVVVDNSLRMLEDGTGYWRDPTTWRVSDDLLAASALGVDTLANTTYRRKYQNFDWDGVTDDSKRYIASTIVAVPNTSPEYATFWGETRLEIAKSGIAAAVGQNDRLVRWGLIKLRQDNPKWRNSCDKPVTVSDPALAAATDSSPCTVNTAGKFGVYTPDVVNSSYNLTTLFSGGSKVITPAPNSGPSLVTYISRPLLDPLSLIPASRGGQGYADRPLTFALNDARQAVIDAMAADTAAMRTCRNTIVVLVTGGKNSGSSSYVSANNVTTTASTFMSVASGGVTKRVPIHVLGLKVPAAEKGELQTVASNSGGLYRDVTTAAEVTRYINHAVQQAFARAGNFDEGRESEFQSVSPIVGTVNMKGGNSASGSALPHTDILTNPGNLPVPQRSNILITAGFSLPGFEGRLRAFRTYRPEPDSTKPIGWKFVSDGTRLWPDVDGRPELAGLARTPADPASRNIYTFIPDGAGGGSVVHFNAGNAAVIAPHLGTVGDATLLINAVRAQNIGAIIGSTPALMDAPSLDPPPDDEYGRPDALGTFAGDHKDRRSIIFFGANDGMIHAVDARTGFEVWAFIPYNLLPKLRTLVDGQPVEQFDFFVDSSPKIAEVKLNGQWRSMLIIGQGPGGTFYQAFDVTEAGMGVDPAADGLGAVSSLLPQFDSPNESIAFKWSFPNYSSFEPNYTATFSVTDGTASGRVRMYGDIRKTAPLAEKTVGFTWSDPAVGPLDKDRIVNAVIVGSGYFPPIEDLLPGRGASAPRAGDTLYLIDADTGTLIGNASGAGCNGTGCLTVGEKSGNNGRKNALQADPTAAGETGSPTVSKAYLGDVDGRYWKFTLSDSGSISKSLMLDTLQPLYASSALLFIGSADVYALFSTGSDLLPSNAPGGTGTFKLYGLKDNGNNATTKFSINLAAVSDTNGLATGERPSTSPSVAGDIVFYTTTTESATTPCSDFASKLYAVTYAGGAAYDSNNDGRLGTNESPVARTMAGRATAPFIVDQHLYLGTSSSGSGSGGGPPGSGDDTAKVEAFGDPEDFNNGMGQVGVRILSWREIR